MQTESQAKEASVIKEKMKRIIVIMCVVAMAVTAQAQLTDSVGVTASVGAGSGNFLTIAPENINDATNAYRRLAVRRDASGRPKREQT